VVRPPGNRTREALIAPTVVVPDGEPGGESEQKGGQKSHEKASKWRETVDETILNP
jgi:hypothetical protein